MLTNCTKIIKLNNLSRCYLTISSQSFTNWTENHQRGFSQVQSRKNFHHKIQNHERKYPGQQIRSFSNPMPPSNNLDEVLVDANTYEIVCNETLEDLCDYFDELVESNTSLKDADIIYGDGVLTIKLGGNKGTYVINRQSPNRQIWLSSPISGPKRYDFIPTNDQIGEKCEGYWIYKHDGVTLHELLQSEIPTLIGSNTNFMELCHSQK